MSGTTEAVIRATLTERMAKIIKRQRYTPRHIEQILRASSEKAALLHGGQLDGFTTDELRKIITILE